MACVPGEYRASDLGGGLELAQVRPYEPGDDVRRIDWNVTARTTIPHVRVFVPERALTTWLLLDVSPSMTFGTADRRKADVAEGVAIAVGHLATQRGNRLGLVTFGGGSDRRLPPTAGRQGLLASLVAARAAGDAALPAEHAGAVTPPAPSRPPRRSASSRAFRRAAGCLSSCPISAARATGRRRSLAASTKHHVLVVEIRDPREDVLPDVGDLTLVDGETGREVRVNTSSRQLRERFAAAAADERAGLETDPAPARRRSRRAVDLGQLAADTRHAAARPREGRMSFASPELLLGLLIVPLALIGYLLVQRRRSRYAVRFTNVDLLANIAPRTPSWRRHLPPVLYLAAIAALAIGLARPSLVLAVPREEATIMLTMDVSRSMRATDVDPNRLVAAQQAATDFVDRLPEQFRVGLVAFSTDARLVVQPTTTAPRSTRRSTAASRTAARPWATPSRCRSRRPASTARPARAPIRRGAGCLGRA